jgi:hypothetical protein
MRPNFDDVNDDSNNDDEWWLPVKWDRSPDLDQRAAPINIGRLYLSSDDLLSLYLVSYISLTVYTTPQVSSMIRMMVWRQLMMGYESDCIDGDVSTLYRQSIVTFSQ